MKNLSFSIILLCLIVFARAQTPGSIDSTYGVDGVSTTSIEGFNANVTKMVFQSDGKLVTVASLGITGIVVARYNENGSLDTEFGEQGLVTINDDSVAYLFSRGIQIQPDGKIIIAATASDAQYTQEKFVLYRLLSTGEYDTEFGISGSVITGFTNMEASDMKLQSDGKIVVAGFDFTSTTGKIVIVRYIPDGKIDTSFGTHGKVIKTFKPNHYPLAYSLAIQDNGKILVGGALAYGMFHFFIARFNEDGSLDESFGNHGMFTTNFGKSVSGVVDMAIQGDGKIIGVGYGPFSGSTFYDFKLFRINDNGILDPSFGDGGTISTEISLTSHLEAAAVLVQPDGKIVVNGSAYLGNYYQFIVARYNSNGSLDTDFGNNGIVLTVPLDPDARSTDAVLQSDGKLLVGGESFSNSTHHYLLAIVRYNTGLNLRTLNISEAEMKMFVYPNPVGETVLLDYDLIEEARSSALLYDMNGTVIKSFFINQDQTVGHHELKLDVSAIAKGNYLLELDANENRSVVTLVKQ